MKNFVTGISVISPFGSGFERVFPEAGSGKKAYGQLGGIDFSTMPVKVGGVVPEEMYQLEGIPHNKLRGMGKYVPLGIKAALDAAKSANLDHFDAERVGAFVSSGTHGRNAEGLFPAFHVSRSAENELDLKKLGEAGIDNVHPWWLLSTISNNLIFFVTHFLGIKGANTNYCNSSVAGAYALDCAISSLNDGKIDIAFVGGADTPINWQIFSDFSLTRFLAEGPFEEVFPLRPFSPEARGAILSEAGAFLILETEESVVKRGVTPFAEVGDCAFFGAHSGGISPEPSGIETKSVLSQLVPQIPKGNAGLIYVSGVGHPDWDGPELLGLKSVFADQNVSFSAAKATLGHSYSISVILETAIAAAGLRLQKALPFAARNCEFPSTLIPVANVNHSHQAAIVLGQCFGGSTGGILLHVV